MGQVKLKLDRVVRKRLIRQNENIEEITVLRNISVEIESNEVFTVVGPSGSGKSTLLRLLNRLEDLSDGSIFLDGQNIKEMDVVALRRKVGLVFQVPILFDGTVETNILFSLKIRREIPPLAGEGVAEKYINLVGLDRNLLSRNSNELSVGQKQRISIARALTSEPEVLLMDEPTSALDPTATHNIENLILDLKSKIGLTIVFVTHDIEQAKRVGERGMVLVNGEKIEEGKIPDLFENPQNTITKKFVDGILT
ncbi:MAG: phosphate ABC transporter ATP-binding protein [candidate division Zixibacteria bacterium]|nr:phosphate ABC transporter ATP-binding protein [candidate division Zixibacteria bacterium]